jgi:CRISPR/Cas system-associated exonuclease Cas4 (RecB family)
MVRRELGELILYPLGHNPTKELLRRAISRVRGPDFRGILYLVPHRIKSQMAQLEFANIFEGSACIPPRFKVFAEISDEIAQSFTNWKQIPDTLATLILWQTLKSDGEVQEALVGEGREVSIFTAFKVHGFYNELRDYLDEKGILRLKEAVEEDLYEYDKLKKRTQLVLDHLTKYRDALEKRKLLDRKECLRLSLEAPDWTYPSSKVLVVDGFLEWTPMERHLLERLIERSKYSIVALPDPGSAEEGKDLLEASLSFIKRLGQWKVERIEGSSIEPESLLSFPTIRSEVTYVAHRIKEIVQSENKRVLVTAANMEVYSGLIGDVFSQCGIPFALGKRITANLDPIYNLFLDLLNCVVENYGRRQVIRVLSSPYLGLDQDLRLWMDGVTRALQIVEGKEEWLDLRKRAEVYPDEIHSDRIFIEKLSSWVEKFFEVAEAFRDDGTPCEFADRFRRFWKNMGGTLNLEENSPLLRALESMDLLGEIKLSTSQIYHLLRTLGGELEIPERQELHLPVQVVEFRSSRGLYSDYVFFLGLRDGDIPTKMEPDPFLPEKTREKVGLPGYSHHYSLQALDFWRVIRSGREGVFLSYARDVMGRSSIPSIFADFLEERETTVGLSDGIFSEEEFQRLVSFKEKMSCLSWMADPPVRDKIYSVATKRIEGYRSLSVTQIESYAICPYRFLHEDILGLSMKSEPEYEVDARTLGTVLHRVLELVYRDKEFKGKRLKDEVVSSLNRVADEFAIKELWREAIRSYLLQHISILEELERRELEAGYRVKELEKWIEHEIDGVKVTGKIDRVDSTGSSFHLIDYKSGSAPDPLKNMRSGLQLLLYGAIYGEIFKVSDLSAFFVSFKDEKGIKSPVVIDESTRGKVIEHARWLIRRIFSGEFDPDPEDGSRCGGCLFKPSREREGLCPYWMRKG